MKLNKFAVIVGACVFAAAAMPSIVRAAPATVTPGLGATRKKVDRVTGKVTAVDPTAGTITIHDKKLDTDTIATVTATTNYKKSKNVGVAGLSVGDTILVHNTGDIAAGTTTISAERIEVLSPLAEERKRKSDRSMQGTITALSPLTISADDGSSVTITTSPTTRVMASEPATLADVVVGTRVQAVGKLKDGTFIASSVTVQPVHERGARKLDAN